MYVTHFRPSDGTQTFVPAIVSLTSYPARIGWVHLTLLSLLDQTLTPQKIVLSLSTSQFPDRLNSLPKRLRSILVQNPDRVEVMWTEPDVRSYKKLVPARQAYPELVIITADDDVLYAHDWLERLWSAHAAWPNTIIGTRGHAMPLDTSGEILPYLQWVQALPNRPSRAILLTGVGGILYPPGSLPANTFDSSLFMAACPTADDIWFKCASVTVGTLALLVDGSQSYIPRFGTQRTALWRMNVDDKMNDIQLDAAMSVYALTAGHFADHP
jgi:hypothetical protein